MLLHLIKIKKIIKIRHFLPLESTQLISKMIILFGCLAIRGFVWHLFATIKSCNICSDTFLTHPQFFPMSQSNLHDFSRVCCRYKTSQMYHVDINFYFNSWPSLRRHVRLFCRCFYTRPVSIRRSVHESFERLWLKQDVQFKLNWLIVRRLGLFVSHRPIGLR